MGEKQNCVCVLWSCRTAYSGVQWFGKHRESHARQMDKLIQITVLRILYGMSKIQIIIDDLVLSQDSEIIQ